MVDRDYAIMVAKASRNLSLYLMTGSLATAVAFGYTSCRQIEEGSIISGALSGGITGLVLCLGLYAFKRARMANNLARRIESDITERIN